MKFLNFFLPLAGCVVLNMPILAATDGWSNFYDCAPRQIQNGEWLPFDIDSDSGSKNLIAKGSFAFRLHRGDDDISAHLEMSIDRDTGQMDYFMELDGNQHRGHYLIEITKAGHGTICITEPNWHLSDIDHDYTQFL